MFTAVRGEEREEGECLPIVAERKMCSQPELWTNCDAMMSPYHTHYKFWWAT